MCPSGLEITPVDFDAVIFDLDGVITKTAQVHAAAWKKLFDEYLRQRAEREGGEFVPFDAEGDYLRYVDGKPRSEGVASFLASRAIHLEPGAPNDPPAKETIAGLGNRKNEFFRRKLEEKGPEVYESSLELIRRLRQARVKIGLVSSSRNAGPILQTAGIEHLFDAKIDGVDAQERQILGKPAPDLFLAAARELQVAPGRAIVVEDAIAGVQAGRAGGFGRVIGVARSRDPESLAENGADVVVADLAELTVVESSPPGQTRPAALEHLAEISWRQGERELAIFLDYDGTLTPIVENPAAAVLPAATREVLQELGRLCFVAVISGRDLQDVRQLVKIDYLYYAGSHGFDIAGPAGQRLEYQQGVEYLPALEQAEQALDRALGHFEGVKVERKKFAIAVHFRRAPDRREEVEQAVDAVLAQQPRLRKSGGKMIVELRPGIDWHKGKAVSWLLERLGLDRAKFLPIYLGDDLTDEDAFREIRAQGIGILVSETERPTEAAYSLENPDQVAVFLRELVRLARNDEKKS